MGKSARYIGSSDAPPIVGVPSYGTTEIDVWERMVGQAPERSTSANMRWGNLLEPLILAEYAALRGVTIDRRHRRFYHPDHAFLGCTVDARAGDVIVEAKSTAYGREYGYPGDGPEGLPPYVRVQVQHQMMVTGATMTHVPVLISGYDLRVFEVPADPVFQQDLLDELVEWHGLYVVTRTPPPVDDSASYERHLRRRYPQADGETMAAPRSLRPVFRRWAKAAGDAKDAEARLQAVKNIVRDTMGAASVLEGEDVRVTYANQRTREVAWELIAAAYRRILERGVRESLPLRIADNVNDPITTETLDSIESMHTRVGTMRVLRPKWSGMLKDMVNMSPQEEEQDAVANRADA